MAEVLRITLQHATTKHARKIGILEQTHASFKKTLKTEQVKEDPCGISMSILRF